MCGSPRRGGRKPGREGERDEERVISSGYERERERRELGARKLYEREEKRKREERYGKREGKRERE